MRHLLLALACVGLMAALVGCVPEKREAAPRAGAVAPTVEQPAAPAAEKPAAPAAEQPAAPTAEKPVVEPKAVPAVEAPPVEAPAVKKPASTVIRINCGAEKEYTDETGAVWAADQVLAEGTTWGALDGETVLRDLKISEGTKAPEVFLTERFNMKGYQFALPNGKYTVRLLFAETYDGITQAGERVFSVKIQGQDALADFDPFKDGGGFAKPVVKEFKGVGVTDGKLLIEFVPNIQSPEINGIEIVAE